MLLQSQYVQDSDCSWWAHSGQIRYLHDGENVEAAKARFYAPTFYIDAFGGKTTVDYYKDYYLMVEKVTDGLGNFSEVKNFDFRTMQPKLLVTKIGI